MENVFYFDKYGIKNSQKLIYTSVFQVLFTLLFMSYLFDNTAKTGSPDIFIYGFFILITIYSDTELIHKNSSDVVWQLLRLLAAITITTYCGDWFGLNHFFSLSNYIIFSYFSLSFLITIYFVKIDFKNQPKPLINS